jgi:hypothetical protein
VIFNSVPSSLAGVVTLLVTSLLVGACTPASSPDAPAIAAVHTQRCGSCHAPPEPRSHTRASLEDALGRHHHRVHLSEGEWQAMIDYLAPEAPRSEKN